MLRRIRLLDLAKWMFGLHLIDGWKVTDNIFFFGNYIMIRISDKL